MSDARGFTLIEVLAAAALLAVAVLVAAQMSLVAFGQVNRSGERTTAVALAKQRVEWLRNQDYVSAALAAGTSVESLTASHAGYSRTTTIVDDSPRAGIKQVTVAIVSPTGYSMQTLALIAAP